MIVHEHGTAGALVIAIHGGPGAPGSVAAVARHLGGRFRVLEPWQRGAGKEPLTVARHVADLRQLLDEHARDERPLLVGHSWGAMLALACAAEVPERVAGLALVCPGTFDVVARARFHELRAQLSYDYDTEPVEERAFDERANHETWNDYLRCERQGRYPAAFASIRAPAILLHGAADPHPGRLIRESLLRHMPQLEYVEWARCGHEPWRERHARDDFFAVLDAWLAAHAPRQPRRR